MNEYSHTDQDMERRRVLRTLAAGGIASALGAWDLNAWSAETVTLPFAGGTRDVTTAFPQKSKMLLLRTRPPLLETPFAVFDKSIFTPNNQFFVRWHLANIPSEVDGASFRLNVHGEVNKQLSLSLKDLLTTYKRVDLVAVNQCSGNSRGLFNPRVAGGQWANGAMGNALWSGVRLKDILDKAGIRSSAVQVRFNGLDTGVIPSTPDFIKSLDIDHARDGEVMVAYAMNGKPLPLLNGFPLRLIVPGWYSTYWVKMLNDIEVLDHPDDNFWMSKAYLIPDTPHANIEPGQTGVKMIPINRMVPRSFFTNVGDGTKIQVNQRHVIRGIAFGGNTGIQKVLVSTDDGNQWSAAQLGHDHGKYSFRQWETHFTPSHAGQFSLKVKAVNNDGVEQPATANWNPGGFMRNVIESITVTAA